jgi:hypothetical protein
MNHHAEGQMTLTRPGPGGPGTEQSSTAPPRHRERHRQVNWLRDVILGGQDGLVNVLGIILGVIAGGGSQTGSVPPRSASSSAACSTPPGRDPCWRLTQAGAACAAPGASTDEPSQWLAFSASSTS